jgi:plasmid replication initiation protein
MVNVGFNSGFQQQLFVSFPVSSSPSLPNHKVSADLIEQLNDIIMAQYDMSLYERRIFIKVIELMPLELPEFNGKRVMEEIIIDAREIIEANGLKGESAYMELKKATASLIKHVCKISESDGLLQVALLSSAKYLKGKGQIILKFDSNLHPYLLKLKNQFSTFQLEKLINFKSYYSQCLYELLKKVQKPNGTFVISVEQLRNILKIEETEYKRYYDLKRYVIQQAQKELTEHDVSFLFNERKQGKKVIAIQFVFRNS